MKVDSEPEQKEPSTPEKPNAPTNSEPSNDNSVTLDDNGNEQEEGEVQVTDGDGNVVK